MASPNGLLSEIGGGDPEPTGDQFVSKSIGSQLRSDAIQLSNWPPLSGERGAPERHGRKPRGEGPATGNAGGRERRAGGGGLLADGTIEPDTTSMTWEKT